MNVKLLAASALMVQCGVLLVCYQLFRNCPVLSQSKSAVHIAQAGRHWRHLKGNYELNSAFEKDDRLFEPRA